VVAEEEHEQQQVVAEEAGADRLVAEQHCRQHAWQTVHPGTDVCLKMT
jgi:hypothetical protein